LFYILLEFYMFRVPNIMIRALLLIVLMLKEKWTSMQLIYKRSKRKDTIVDYLKNWQKKVDMTRL